MVAAPGQRSAGLAMRYIRARESNGAIVVFGGPVIIGLSALAVSFASACVPAADLSSYSSATSTGAIDLAEGPAERSATSAPRRPSSARGGDASADGAPSSDTDERLSGTGARLDPGEEGPTPSSPPPDDTGLADVDAADAAARLDAAPLPDIPPEPDAVPAPLPVCGEDEIAGPNGHCYLLVVAPLTWDAARSNCQRRGVGWDLTSIRSAADSAFVMTLRTQETWIGGSDGSAEETWAWVDDGIEFWQGEGPGGRALNGAFVNWFEDEPNGSLTSDCMRMLDDSRWADFECSELRPSLCEGPAP